VNFGILGPLEVTVDDRLLDLGAQKRVLIALLLLEANRVVPGDRLVDALWEENPPDTARKALQVHVSQLRKLLGRDRIVTRPGGYLLRVEPGELDLSRFLALQQEGRFDEALALWRGAPLADIADHSFARPEVARLRELRLACEEERFDRELAAGRHAELVGELEALVGEHPLRERLRGQLMIALYRAGRQAEALDEFASARRLLVDALGIEPGIGKSRLAEELIAEAQGRDMHVLVGRCWEAGGAPAYWPWVQSLRVLADAGAVELGQFVPGASQEVSSGAEGARVRLFDAAARFVRDAASKRPILLVLDDLHAADAPSLHLLRYVGRELATMRVLLLAVYRDVDPVPGDQLAEALADLTREPVSERIGLTGLSREELEEYVQLAAPDVASPELVRRVHVDTEGNPLFAGEIVRLHTAEAGSPEHLALPQSVRDVIARRLRHLSAACNRVLALASVFGREFGLQVLALAAAMSEEALLDLLDEAMAARVVSDVPGAPGRLRFAHVLIRDTLYESLTPARRARLHRLVVDTLEARYGEREGPHLAELAYHSIAGGDFERGARYAARAAGRALVLLAFEESARLYRAAADALRVAAPADEAGRCELLLALGEAEARAGDFAAAEGAFAEAAGIADRLGLPRELARAALGHGARMDWSRAGHDTRRVALLERALARLPADDLELRPRLLGRLAGALRDEHSPARRDALSAEAVELARRTADRSALAYALSGRAAAICAPDTVAERLAIAAEVQQLATQAGDLERVVAGHMHRVIALLQLGDTGEARAALAAAEEVAVRLGQPAQLWEVRGGVAMMELAAGRFEAAESIAEDAFGLGEHTVPDGAIPVYLLQRCGLRDFRGGLDASVPDLERLIEDYPARPVFRCALAHVRARLGDRWASDQLAALTRDGCAAIPFDQEWLFAMSLLAEACWLVGQAPAAATVYDLLLPWEEATVADPGEGFRGAAARDLGLLATVLERFDEADRHFRAAIAMNTEMDVPPWLARTRESYSRMLLVRDSGGDRQRGRELLAQAAAGYRELGVADGLTAP
jgi:DNA-binding SARP family transcriptional activator